MSLLSLHPNRYALLADELYEEFMKAMEPQMKAAKLENGHYVISYNNLKKASASLKASIGKARRKIEVERVTKRSRHVHIRRGCRPDVRRGRSQG